MVGWACLLMVAQSVLAPSAPAATRYDKHVAGREVVMVVPDRQDGPAPLVIALHGCDQSPNEYLASTGLEALVDEHGFAVALPGARATGDNPLGCWRWWDPENQRRDGPEPRRIMNVIPAMDLRVDDHRVYVLGFSSGAAMAVILGNVYPDVVTAIGIHSGVGFAGAGGTACALKLLTDAPDRSEARGELAYLHQVHHRIVPTLILHGREDDVVDPRHASGLVRELAQRNDLIDDGNGDNDSYDARADATATNPGPCRAESSCYPHELERFEDRRGAPLLQKVMVEDLGHAWSGGREGHRYTDRQGPHAAAMFWRFFARHRLDPDALKTAQERRCRHWWGPPWWHFMWAGTMTFAEYACDMNPWRMVWRHRIDGVSGPGRCP